MFLARTNLKSVPIHLAAYGAGAVDLMPDASPLVCSTTVLFDHCYVEFIWDRLCYDVKQGCFLDVSWTKIIHTIVE